VSGINRQPLGLLSFFGIKNSGRNPSALAESIAPTLDLSQWYLATNSQSTAINDNVAAVGFTTFIQVPQNETWAILACTVNSQNALGAGQTLRIGGAFSRPSVLGNVVAPLTLYGESVTVGAVAVAWSNPGSIVFVPPGATVGLYCAAIAAGPIPCTLNLNFVPMGI